MRNETNDSDIVRPKDVRASAVGHVAMVVRAAVAAAVADAPAGELLANELEQAMGGSPDVARLWGAVSAMRSRKVISRHALQYVADAILPLTEDPDFFRSAFSSERPGLSLDDEERIAQMDVRIVGALRAFLSFRFRKVYPDAYRGHFEARAVARDVPREIALGGGRRWYHLRSAFFETPLRPWREAFFQDRKTKVCGFPEYLPGFREELAFALYGDYLKWLASEANHEKSRVLKATDPLPVVTRATFEAWERKYFSRRKTD